MNKNEGLSVLIYEYYESRILFGIYRCGELLPSVPQICATFRLGRNTVQSALDRLEKMGYIRTEERKVAKVIYEGTEERYRKNVADYFVPRTEGILDFQYAGEFLFLPLWKIGVKNLGMDTPGNAYWEQYTVRGTLPAPSRIYFDVLHTFHNDLIQNLYWQCLRYNNFLYPKRKEKEDAGALAGLLPLTDLSELKQAMDDYFSETQEEVLAFAEFAREKYHLEAAVQIPFQWTIYRRRPQMRYTLASRIIREILWERYPAGTYLPSLPQMAERYQVSLSTVRRTVDVLNAMGITRTYMGIGTKVCLEPVEIDLMNVSEIRENLRLHGEGMEFLALTVRGVTLFTLESATEEKRKELGQNIVKLQGKTSGILCIDVLLSFISSECPSMVIRECYGKLRELTAWGYILSAILMRDGQLNMNFTDFISQLVKDLEYGDFSAFADRWQSFIGNRTDFFYSKFPFRLPLQDKVRR